MTRRAASNVWAGFYGLMIATTLGAQVVHTAPAGRRSAVIVGCEGLLLAGLGAGLLDELQGKKSGPKAKPPLPPAP
jgi:NADH:ubiquinone oxidoreductase subunit F (NADH-binding)